MRENKTVAVLGATGSVGTQALDIARRRKHRVEILTANNNIALIEKYSREFLPRYAVLADEGAAAELRIRLRDTDVKVLAGKAGILEALAESKIDAAVNAITGFSGLEPTLAVLDKGARLCLANKESLVVAGDVVMKRAKEKSAEIIPVDSEHSAIFQSAKSGGKIKRIFLTASGGPFRGMSREQLSHVSVEDTLRHPTWKMGKRITVDSATLMNKGFEVIEAVHLFDVCAKNIEVIIHPQSILHSAVEYADNAVIAQLSQPDMRLSIQYALDYPDRASATVEPLDFVKLGSLTFSAPDSEAFPLLSLAYRAAEDGGAMGAVLNAADEVATAAFLSGEIPFNVITDTVFQTYESLLYARELNSLDDIRAADSLARQTALDIIARK